LDSGSPAKILQEFRFGCEWIQFACAIWRMFLDSLTGVSTMNLRSNGQALTSAFLKGPEVTSMLLILGNSTDFSVTRSDYRLGSKPHTKSPLAVISDCTRFKSTISANEFEPLA
jgi:hypothetical protein